MSDLVEEILHYGVKGMKWGKRKSQSTKTKTTYRKPPKALSDSELKKRIARLEAEQRYNQLNKQHVSQGKEIANEILVGSGKKIAKSVVVGVGTVLVKNAIEAKYGKGMAAGIKIGK